MDYKQKTSSVARRNFLKAALTGVAAAALPSAPVLAAATARAIDLASSAQSGPTPPALGGIALNRAAFGPKPGVFDLNTFNNQPGANDTQRLASFIEWQLNPGAINDSDCDARLAAANLPTLKKSLTQLWTDHYKTSGGNRTQPVQETSQATWIRGVYSQRQLFEVLVNFWHNHFSVYAWDYGFASATWVHYDRDVIRAHALGNFRALLEAVATSPAMLFYLNNYANQAGGPNENWARELFELHTMGAENYLGVGLQTDVPGYPAAPVAYVDADVYETTRCFTGWRVNDGEYPLNTSTGEFLYYDSWHDRFQKTVLGHFIPPDGAPMANGRTVLDLLVAHPGTARFIARKLCRRLIGDNPPQAVVDAAAAEFAANINASDQIKRVVRVILNSPEFANTWGDKIKQPFEAALSLLRASNANFSPSNSFTYLYEAMGQPLFSHHSPDGYADVKSAWTNTSSMLKRWQMAMSLTENTITSISTDLNAQTPSNLHSANALVDFWIERILTRPLSNPAQRTRMVDFMRGPYAASFDLPASHIVSHLPRMVALILMSPDFQYR